VAWAFPTANTRVGGFTLIEALVALAIVAFGMMAVNAQLGRFAATATYMKQKTLASWIATNKITELSLAAQWPGVGKSEGDLEFANQEWFWQAEVTQTELPNLRRVDVSVSLRSDREAVLHKVSGLLEPPAPPGFGTVSWIGVAPAAGERE
jgi:general secretion pathway protein I